MAEYWINGVGQNMLSGIPGDADNPALLTDDYILDFLTHSPVARASFDRLLPTMTADEQERLGVLAKLAGNGFVKDAVDASDTFQHRLNTSGVRRGGAWRPSGY